MTTSELIATLQQYPPDAPVALRGGRLIEVNAINPTGPDCCVWIDPLGTSVLTEIALDETNPTQNDP